MTRMEAPPLPAPDWALFFDVDGCLLDFAAHPSDVVVPAGLQHDLLRLSAQLGGALAIESTRQPQMRPSSTMASAIWTALSAAPLRRLSETTQRLRP